MLAKKLILDVGQLWLIMMDRKKHRTTIEDGAFIGCNTNLVSPVTVHEKAYTAAGSTITEDVPTQALGIARARQKNIDQWAKRNR